jgi:hypothetical protein
MIISFGRSLTEIFFICEWIHVAANCSKYFYSLSILKPIVKNVLVNHYMART